MPAKSTRKRSRNSKNFVAIPFDGTLSLGTLNNDVLVSLLPLSNNLTEDLFAISADINAQIIALTAGEGDPMMAGWAHDDYSDTEILENLQVDLLGPGNKIEQEKARRLVRNSGLFMPTAEAATQLKLFGRYGSGMIRTKLKFVVQSGHGLKFWVFNKSGANLTTGSSLRIQGTVYGRWIL